RSFERLLRLGAVLLAATSAAAELPVAPLPVAPPPTLGLPGGRLPATPRPHPTSLSTGRAQVVQGATRFSIRPVEGNLDIVSYYGYGTPNASCANTGLETYNTSLLFLYQDDSSVPPALSLVMIN